MATRDLTQTFLRLRSAMHRKVIRADDVAMGSSSGAAGLLQNAGGAGVDLTSLSGGAAAGSPIYVEQVEQINGDINGIQAKITDLRRAHDARLRMAFNADEEKAKEREIEILTAEVTRGFNNSAVRLKRLANYTASADNSEIKIRKNIQRGLATRLQELSMEFKSTQKVYIGQIQKMQQGTSLAALIGDAPSEDRDEGMTDEQLHDMAVAEEDVDERMREIQRIAKSMDSLSTLFKELATLVVEQGTILDRIDYNMEQTVENVKKGVVELKDAEKYQKSARPVKCMILLMVLITICVIIIIVKTG